MKATIAAALAVLLAACAAPSGRSDEYEVRGDSIPNPLTATPGDASRGRLVVIGREGNCVLCHTIPGTGERFMGNVGPPLTGVGARLTPGQMRLRIADPTRVNRAAAMPAYYRVDGLTAVASDFAGKPILTAQQVEDAVAFLQTLR